MVQVPHYILSNLLFTSVTTICIGSLVPVHQFEGMDRDELFQMASLTISSEMVQACPGST